MNEGKITEIFSSLQGEGLYVGVPQFFVRFHGCNMKCGFCDTKQDSYENHTYRALIEKIEECEKPFHSISLTGGEPLLQADFIEDFLREYKEYYRKPIYLETNGTLWEGLLKVVHYVDIIAMDFKLPSSTGQRSYWAEHEEFLRIAKNKETFVKAVVTSSTQPEDIVQMNEIIKRVACNTPVVLQPVTASAESERADGKKLRNFMRILRESVRRVDIIPQVHKMIGAR
ncbi:MAG: 7-carboxy-7-deazaguanine synthase QueE [Candidatus Omnitrophica bacterium]|nr:7-carboxy-7-deazaguanine synthase QueE [Candidatus Omnitrophota bacterium]